jgi:Tfp pilus assembly protein PilF
MRLIRSGRVSKLAFLLLIPMLAGCGSSVPSQDIASAQQAMDEATTKLEAGDEAAAIPLLTQAIDGIGLDADQYARALLLRAQCYAQTGDVELAEADLADAEQGPTDEGLLFFTKGIVFQAQGKKSDASKAFSRAKRIDPGFEIPR